MTWWATLENVFCWLSISSFLQTSRRDFVCISDIFRPSYIWIKILRASQVLLPIVSWCPSISYLVMLALLFHFLLPFLLIFSHRCFPRWRIIFWERPLQRVYTELFRRLGIGEGSLLGISSTGVAFYPVLPYNLSNPCEALSWTLKIVWFLIIGVLLNMREPPVNIVFSFSSSVCAPSSH